MSELKKLLVQQVQQGCSDLHLVVGEAPILRQKNGELQALATARPLTLATLEAFIRELIGEPGWRKLRAEKEVGSSFTLPGTGRFRATFYEETRGPAIALRTIPFGVPEPAELAISPPVLESILRLNGLILVTGPNGSGKSTTLASLIEYINNRRACHIITIEDPIEFTFTRKKALISQRAVGLDAVSFAAAVKHTLRQDVDVIMIGEMRDLETIATAITLAETGHLVLATLHTDDAARAIQRIVDVFPGSQQAQIALQLSYSLTAILSQRLLPNAERTKRICVREVLFANSAVRHAIRARKTSEIYSQMQINRAEGMQLFDDQLREFVQKGLITREVALASAHDLKHFEESLT